MSLEWRDLGDRYTAEGARLSYVVQLFNPATQGGDPKLWIYDDQYRSECWSLRVWDGNDTKGARLFDSPGDAMRAAQIREDNQ